MFIYTREAHPGENVPHHGSFEHKLAHARRFRDELGIRRPILVDDLAGTTHQRYGRLPNMTWVVHRGGRVVYKAEWTSAANVEAFVEQFYGGRDQSSGSAVSRYLTEQLEFRDVDFGYFRSRLEFNGRRAVEEFERARELWSGPPR